MSRHDADYDRVKELFDSGVISKEEFEQSETSLSRAEEEMQNAKDNLEIVQNGIASRNAEMSNTQIRSTITGMILDVPVKVGNSVIQSNTFNDGTTIATVADLNDMIFRGKVDETEVGRLKEQMPVKLTIGALQDISLDATLDYIAPKGTEGGTCGDVRDQGGDKSSGRYLHPRRVQRECRHRNRTPRRGADHSGKLRNIRRQQNLCQPVDQRLYRRGTDLRTQGGGTRHVRRGEHRDQGGGFRATKALKAKRSPHLVICTHKLFHIAQNFRT